MVSNRIDVVSSKSGKNKTPLVSVITTVFNRVDSIVDTIDSVRSQTYSNIEYIVIDGDSTDGTQTVISKNLDRINYYDSSNDLGIYDGMNRGIDASNGKYICHIHAGDTYTATFIEEAVKLAEEASGNAIVYAGHCRDGVAVPLGTMNSGFLLHHLGINHLAFLVPLKVYRELGAYDVNLKIVSDHVWMRRAYLSGIDFIRMDRHVLNFAANGASDSTGDESQKDQIISENIAALRMFFPFIPEDIARALYLYRFKENQLWRIRDFVAILKSPEANGSIRDARIDDFCDALTKFLIYVWSNRRLDIRIEKAGAGLAGVRISISDLLDIGHSYLNISYGPAQLTVILNKIDKLHGRFSDKRIIVHYVEFFSRPSETFIRNFITDRRKENSDEAHILICDKKVFLKERPFVAMFDFDFPMFSAFFSRYITEYFMEKFSPELMVFHFIRNAWLFLNRIDSKYSSIPSVYMSHGIDVFSLNEGGPYCHWVKNVASKLPNVQFTAVSGYLASELSRQGVSKSKITILHNSVSDFFWKNRKPGSEKNRNYGAGKKEIRLINVGRLVSVKGHAEIIKAVSLLVNEHDLDVKLTIVYGSHEVELQNCTRLCEDLDVSDRVKFVESVDFEANPTFFHDYDIFVSGSKYTSDIHRRSETFGMAILEAIAAGLPVVVTDAGGQSEVCGPENKFARVARHSDERDLCKQIMLLIQGGALESDNHEYAKSRLKHFSAKKQSKIWKDVVKAAQVQPPLSALLISTNLEKGAGAAALRVHNAILEAGVNSWMLYKDDMENNIKQPNTSIRPESRNHITDAIHPTGKFLRKDHTIFSIDTDGLQEEELMQYAKEADVINLHWYARFMSNENVARLTNLGKPVVFTIRDMYPIAGGCHFFHGCENYKYECFPCPQFLPMDVSLPMQTLRWKMQNFNFDNIYVVALSDITREILLKSSMFRHSPIYKIPNPIDLDVFKPMDKNEARRELGVLTRKRLIAYLPSFSSSVKGSNQLLRAAEIISKEPNDEIAIMTAGVGLDKKNFPLEVKEMGHIADKAELAMFYAAADLTIIPSLEETFSNTGLESLACGTPICTFHSGALPEMTKDGRGISVEVGDTAKLARATLSLLDSDNDVSAKCRSFVEKNYSPERIGKLYADLFKELVEGKAKGKTGGKKAKQKAKNKKKTQNLLRKKEQTPQMLKASMYVAARLKGQIKQQEHIEAEKVTSLDIEGMKSPLLDAMLGEQIPVLHVSSLGQRKDNEIHASAGQGSGHVFFGPFLSLPAASYEVRIDLRIANRRSPPFDLASEAVLGDILLDQKDVERVNKDGTSTLTLEFSISRNQLDQHPDNRVEIRFWTAGLVECVIRSVTLSKRTDIRRTYSRILLGNRAR